MKKTALCLMIFFCIAVFCSCGESGTDILLQAHFSGTVLEVYEGGCLMEVSDTGNQAFSVGDLVSVNTSVEGCPSYSAGDCLRIVFDGTVGESYPMQIFKVYSVQKL